MLSDVFEPVWIEHVVIGGVEEIPPDGVRLEEGIVWRHRIKKEVERSLWGRLSGMDGMGRPR